MWLAAILLLFLVPVSWIGLLISWPAWMRHFETGEPIEPSYLSTLGLFSFIYVGLQIYMLIARAKDMIEAGEGEMLFSMIFFTILILTGVFVLGRWIL
jgi:hypothetical protein